MANIKHSNEAGERLAIAATDENDLGTIQISEDVIAAIVRHYALSTPGVVRLGGQSLVGGLAGVFGKRLHDRSIVVDMERKHIDITVTIVVRFGEHVPSVALNVQNVVRKHVEELTGQKVNKVHVLVHNLELEEGAEDEEEAEY